MRERSGSLRARMSPPSLDSIDALFEAVLADVVARQRTHVVAGTLITTARLAPDQAKIGPVTQMLLDLRTEDGDALVWPERLKEADVPAPSVAHTARALFALCSLPHRFRDEAVTAAMNDALRWLRVQSDLDDVTETIVRPYDRVVPNAAPELGLEQLAVRHFTAAWVARALLAVGRPANDPAVVHALETRWDRYDDNTKLWRWASSGDLPIWMTFQSIAAIRFAALANLPSPYQHGTATKS